MMLYVLACYMDYGSGADRSLLGRRFDAFDPELVAPFWVISAAIISPNRCKSYSIMTCSEQCAGVLQCRRTVHGPT